MAKTLEELKRGRNRYQLADEYEYLEALEALVGVGGVADDSLTDAKINSAAAIALSKLANTTAAYIIVANASGVLVAVPLSGDANIDNSGAIQITDFTITDEEQGDIVYFDGTNWVRLAAGTSGQFLKTQGAGANPIWDAAPLSEIPNGTPVNAVAAQATLNITGVVIPGEYITINGVDVYEFTGDDDETISVEGRIAVDLLNAPAYDKSLHLANIVLTVDTQPTLGDTFTIGTKTFTIVPLDSANGEGDVGLGASLAATQANILAAINGIDGFNTPSTQFYTILTWGEEASSNQLVIGARIGGTAGNSIATTETFTAETNVFSGATMSNGADSSAADAVTALVAAITAHDTQGVGAADGAGDTAVFTADIKGTSGNAITCTENMANATFDAGTLGTTTAGVDGTVGTQWQIYADASYLYVAIAANTIADANWRRVSLGSVY